MSPPTVTRSRFLTGLMGLAFGQVGQPETRTIVSDVPLHLWLPEVASGHIGPVPNDRRFETETEGTTSFVTLHEPSWTAFVTLGVAETMARFARIEAAVRPYLPDARNDPAGRATGRFLPREDDAWIGYVRQADGAFQLAFGDRGRSGQFRKILVMPVVE